MTAHISDRPAPPHAETGWSKARRGRGSGPRTCLPAVVDRTGPREDGAERDATIVRGED
ncbi:hypothetical protein H4K36_33735 [Streptomyces sp. DHE7-1]|uniref:hypothetical protein n=1 Tax=unclassified Streptomyces TaxID=2593676 RepID=UPI0018EE4FEF|nr:hypothetical protein [Streptomyces sp. DHE7-1]